MDSPFSISRQKKIEELLEKDVFKVITPNKVVMPKKILYSTKGFNFYFLDNIRDPCINKTYKRTCSIMYTYNNKKKILC